MKGRFTIDGSTELERHLARQCERALEGVQRVVSPAKLEALVLGGGYGRGEGGVLKTETGDRPYNDLEFYVFLRGNRILSERRFRRPLAELGEALSPEGGLHVEFKVDSLARLRHAPVTMFSYDLVSGHRIIAGDACALAGCERHRDAAQIPLAEATRLLFNRCTGLLFCAAKLRQPNFRTEDADFVGRNLAKAQLALGDVVLTAFGQYDWSCRERNRRLGALRVSDAPPALEEIRRHHTAGVGFKLHPGIADASAVELQPQHGEIAAQARRLWLWLEGRRLGRVFANIKDYALSPDNKCPEPSGFKNMLLNAATFGVASLFSASARRYPRERLFDSLPLLLWQAEEVDDGAIRRRLCDQLVTNAASWDDFLAAYTLLWQRFS